MNKDFFIIILKKDIVILLIAVGASLLALLIIYLFISSIPYHIENMSDEWVMALDDISLLGGITPIPLYFSIILGTSLIILCIIYKLKYSNQNTKEDIK